MTLPEYFKLELGTIFSFADHAGDFSPAAASSLEIGTPTDVEMNPGALANGSYYQSAKFNWGSQWQQSFAFLIAVELATTPTAGNTIDAWIAPSTSSTAGNGNLGGVSGSKGSYTGDNSNAADAVKQLDFLGAFSCTTLATANIQRGMITPSYTPVAQYASLVIKNGSGVAFHTDDVEFHIVAIPTELLIQDAV